jgi:hypothetical protein
MSYMTCSLDEALALLNKWKDAPSVFVILTGTVGPLDDSLVGIKFSTIAKLAGFDKAGLMVAWKEKGRFFLTFKGASFVYSDPSRDIPSEFWEQTGGRLVGGLQILLPFGLTFGIYEMSEA